MSLFSLFYARKTPRQSGTSSSKLSRQEIGLGITWKKISGVTISAALVLQPMQAQAQIQRSFLNPSFEQPTFGTASQQCYVQVLPTDIPGWETTHGAVRIGTGNCTGYITPGLQPLIEIWTSGFGSVSTANNSSTAPNAGRQFAELNAEQASQLYQNLCLYQNETITFALLHRGRSSASTADVANFLIGLSTSSSATVFGRFSTTSSGTVTVQPVAQNGATIPNVTNNNAGNGWVRYNGTVPYTGATGIQPVGFSAVSTAGGNNTVGNFLDDVQFAGKPVLEFVTSSGGGAESETNPTTNPPQIRVVGLVPAGGVNVPISVGGTAVLGTDFNTSSGTTTFNLFIPAGNYDGSNATSVFSIPFTVINNNIAQGVRTINFTIQPSSSFFTSSTMTCGGSPIVTASYVIYDDDFLSGMVWNDADNSAKDTFTNINTNSETGTSAGGQIYAILVDANDKVLRTIPVAADGTYTFSDVPLNQNNVKIIISTTAPAVGAAAPAPSLPPNWVNTSPLTTAPFNTGTNIASRDFGIEHLPDTNALSASPQANPGAANRVRVPNLSGTDPEDGALGTGASFKIVTLPSNGTLYYNNVAVTTSGQVISNYDPTKLEIDPNDGNVTISFTYAAIDAAGKEDPTPATVTIPFVLPVSISGTVFHDYSANVVFDNDLGTDVGTNAGSSSLTVYAVNSSGQVVDKATVGLNGTYTLNNIPANSTVTLRLSNNASIAIGSPAPTSPSLPSGWYHTGENLNGTIDAAISTLGDIAITTTTSALTNQNFGIRQGYVIAPDPAPTICNPDYTGALTTGISAAGGQLSVGSFDLNWSVEWLNGSLGATSYAPARPVGPMPAVVVGNLAPGAWVGEPSNARWISYPFRLSNNSNGNHQNADLDNNIGETTNPGSFTGTSDTVRLKYTASVTLPANANAISVSLPIGVSVDNQFVSVRVNGVENLSPLPAQDPQTEDYRATRTVNMTQGWQPGVNIIEIITDSGSPLTGFFLRVEAATIQVCASPNVSVVKRITAINSQTSTQGGDNLSLYKDEASNPYDDNTITIPTQPNPTDPPKDTDKWPNLSTFLVGGTNGGFTKPGDELEYTIYFLSAGDGEAQNVLFCDRVPTNVTFNPTAFNTGVPADPNGISTANRGIVVNVGGNSLALTGVADGDRARYFPPGVEPSLVPEFSGINCNGANTNGAVVVNLGNLNSATAPGVPADSYGFVRFRARVK